MSSKYCRFLLYVDIFIEEISYDVDFMAFFTSCDNKCVIIMREIINFIIFIILM